MTDHERRRNTGFQLARGLTCTRHPLQARCMTLKQRQNRSHCSLLASFPNHLHTHDAIFMHCLRSYGKQPDLCCKRWTPRMLCVCSNMGIPHQHRPANHASQIDGAGRQQRGLDLLLRAESCPKLTFDTTSSSSEGRVAR